MTLVLEKGRGRDRNIDGRGIDQLPLARPFTENGACNPGLCLD